MNDGVGKFGRGLVIAAGSSALTYLVGQGSAHGHADWPYAALAAVCLVGISMWSVQPFRNRLALARLAHHERRLRSSGVGSLWRHSSTQTDAGALRHLKDVALPGVGGGGNQHSPFVRIGAAVGCMQQRVDADTDASASEFLRLLRGQHVTALIESLATPNDDIVWERRAGNGIHRLEAVLATNDGRTVASAALHLPTAGLSDYGTQTDAATLQLHIELPADTGGRSLHHATLAEWFSRLEGTFVLPHALAERLESLQLTVSGVPAARIGIAMHSPHDMLDLVDPEALTPLSGGGITTEFLSWAIADVAGESPADTLRRILAQMCNHTLHLEGAAPTIAKLGRQATDTD